MQKFFQAVMATAMAVLFPAALPAAAARPTVGLLIKVNSTEGFWGEVQKGAREAADAAGVDLVIKGTLNVANSGAQLRLLESMTSQKIDALVLFPTNAERLAGPLEGLSASGLKIVIAESELSSDVPFPFVGYDQTHLAKSATTAFASFVGETDPVALFRGGSDQVIVRRDKVILERLRELHPGINVYVDFFAVTNDESTVQQKAVSLLQKHPDSKLFIASSSLATSELLAAAKAQLGGAKVRIAGFGYRLTPEMVEAIEQGTLAALICQVPREIGYKSVAAAAALIRGEQVPARTDITLFVVTKENLHTPAIQALKTP